MKLSKNISIYLILFFYLTSSLLSSTHIHHKELPTQNDCKVCFIVKNLNSANTSDIEVFHMDYNHCYELPFYSGYFITLFSDKGFNANAPPLS